MKKINLLVVCTGAVVGLAALLLTALGNPGNMGFCLNGGRICAENIATYLDALDNQ